MLVGGLGDLTFFLGFSEFNVYPVGCLLYVYVSFCFDYVYFFGHVDIVVCFVGILVFFKFMY